MFVSCVVENCVCVMFSVVFEEVGLCLEFIVVVDCVGYVLLMFI